ncbi:MAG: ATP-binding cassette domain-containing protein [Pseudomonadota bacterium]
MSGVGVRLERVALTLGGRRVLDGLDLELRPGGRWLLCGANGAGKTQLLKLLAGERWPTPTGRERIAWYDAAGDELALPQLKPALALVGGERQDRYFRHDWNFTVQRTVGTGCRGTDRPLDRLRPAEAARVRELLRRFGLWPLRRRPFLSLSYGQRRLALLARALAGEPRLLLLDEPFNGLDAAARALLKRELARLGRSRTTLVVSAHRAEDVPGRYDSAVVLEAGRVVYAGPPAGAPRAWLDESAPPPPARRKAVRATGAPLVRLANVTLCRDYRPVIVGLDWTIGAGEHWAIVGANGSGKSTLLRFLLGDQPADRGGRIERRAHPPGTHVEAWRRRLGYVSPEFQSEYLDPVSVEELVVSGLRASVGLDGEPTRRERRRAAAALERVGLAHRRAAEFRSLSYGQRRVALIARALVAGPEALLLDEPLTGLDAPSRARTKALLSALAGEGLQLVMAVHHADDLVPEVRRVLQLADGRAKTSTRPDPLRDYFSPLR